MSGYANWNPATTYQTNDIVDYDAKIWVSLQGANLNRQPDISPTFWSQIGGGGEISSITAGAGISVSGSGSGRLISTNLEGADGRLTITSGVGTKLIFNNTCPASVAVGNGLAIAGSASAGLTLSMPNVGTAGTFAYPSSVVADAQGRLSSITAGTAPVASVSAGTGITIGGTATAPSVAITNVGTAGTYAYPTSVQTNAQGQVSAITAGSAPVASVSAGSNITITGTATNPIINATIPPVSGYGRNFVEIFSPGTNLWATGVNFFIPIGTTMPSFYQVSGILLTTPFPYANGTIPPGSYNVEWCCPVSTASTPFSPGTNWFNGIVETNPSQVQYNLTINARLVNRNYGSGTLNAVLDQGTCQAGVYTDTLTNTPYLRFNMLFVASAGSPGGSGAGNDDNIGMEFSMAGFPPGLSYSFNPSGSVSAIEYCKVSASFTS